MNKDALLATLIGFGVGLLIAAIIFIGPSFAKGLPQMSLPSIRMPSFSFSLPSFSKKPAPGGPTPQVKPNGILTIDSPLADSIETRPDILLSGSTNPDAVVVIEGEQTESVVTANGQGAFAGKITLTEGKNDITVTTYAKKTVQSQTIRIYYTPEEIAL